MISRHPFAAHVATGAVRIARHGGVKPGGDRPRVRSVGLVWRQSRSQALPLRWPTQIRAVTSLETRQVVLQRQTETHWRTVIGLPGPSGTPGVDGKLTPRAPHDALWSAGTRMIWSTTTRRILVLKPQEAGPGQSPVLGVPQAPGTPPVSPLHGGSSRSPQRLEWRSGRLAVRAAPAGIVMPAAPSKPVVPTVLAFRTLVPGPKAAALIGRRSEVTWRPEDRPSHAAGVPPQVTTSTGLDKATPATVLEWRKAQPRSSGISDRIADPFVSRDHQRGEALATEAVSPPATRHMAAPDAKRRSVPDPDRPTTMPRFDASDLAQLADEVIRRIDKRERIARERAGR